MTLTRMGIENDVVQWIGIPLLYSPTPDDELYPCSICDCMMRADELVGCWVGPAETAVWISACKGGCDDDA